VTTISSLALHPNYNTLHATGANGCTGPSCHPATADTIHGRTGCYDSCHKNAVGSLTLSCNSGCHTGVYGGDTLSAHVNLHTTDFYWQPDFYSEGKGPTCQDCHSTSDWHDDGNPAFGAISAATSCGGIDGQNCHPAAPGYPGAKGWDHNCGGCH
jgi:hypothetical protein